MEPEAMPTEPWVVDDELWEELLELTHGAAAPCFQCGACTASCPWGMVREGALSVRHFVRGAQVGLLNDEQPVWLCTACGQCEATCPRGVQVVEVLRGLRYLLWERRKPLAGLPSVLWSLYWNGNPWSQPPSQRSAWAKDLQLSAFDPAQHELLYYVGCSSSYDRRAQRVAMSLVGVLRSAGVAFGFLGDDEPCCGEAALNLGHRPYFEELARKAATVFRERGVRTLVTTSPHCYDAFQNYALGADQDFVSLHYTQVLAELNQAGRLRFARPVEATVTYQDPCFLGRRHGMFEPPRSLLRSVPGLRLVEMERYASQALCCGGGGGRMWMETPSGERFSELRVRQAQATGANLIATACPSCILCLEDSVKSLRLRELKVMDVAEIVALALPDTG